MEKVKGCVGPDVLIWAGEQGSPFCYLWIIGLAYQRSFAPPGGWDTRPYMAT